MFQYTQAPFTFYRHVTQTTSQTSHFVFTNYMLICNIQKCLQGQK